MTIRTTITDASRRAQTGIARCTIRKCDDDHDMQEVLQADVMHSETPTSFERWQQVGFTAYPSDQQQGQGQQGQGTGNGGGGDIMGGASGFNNAQPKTPAAEGVMVYPGGSRSHPVCASIDDRRVRPYQMKQGESAMYACDGSGQMLYHRLRGDANDGLYMLTCDPQQNSGGGQREPIDLVVYNDFARDRAGKILRNRDGSQQQQATRFLSIRHVNKQKQQRKSQALNSGGGAQPGGRANGGSGGQQQQYKHEGDSVNTEARFSKQKIEFFDASTNVGYYDRQRKRWSINNGHDLQSCVADQNHVHIDFDGMAVWVDAGGCWSSQPIQIKPDPGFYRADYDGSPESYRRVMGYPANNEQRRPPSWQAFQAARLEASRRTSRTRRAVSYRARSLPIQTTRYGAPVYSAPPSRACSFTSISKAAALAAAWLCSNIRSAIFPTPRTWGGTRSAIR